MRSFPSIVYLLCTLLVATFISSPSYAQSTSTLISLNQAVDGRHTSRGQWHYYRVDNPEGAETATVRLINLSSDLDIYIQNGRLPERQDYSCRSIEGSNTSEFCSVRLDSNQETYIGVYSFNTGFYTLVVDAETDGGTETNIGERSGRIVWEGWDLDYNTFAENDGLILNDVSYEGTQILNSASFPVMTVYYEDNVCGPYADRLNGPQAPVSWADDALLVAREFTREGKQWFELGVREFIGSYDIYQVWYLSEDGELDGHIFSRGLQCNIDHVHYPMWRFDFDLDGPANDQILRETSSGQLTTITTEFETPATDAFQHGWYVEDVESGYRVRIAFDDGSGSVGDGTVIPVSNYENNRVGGVVYRDSEQGFNSGATRTLPYANQESLVGADTVLWYSGYMPHTPEEGSALWHSTGVRISAVSTEELPGPVTALSPIGTADTDTPVYIWEDLGNVDKYELLVFDRSTMSVVYKVKHPSSEICDGTTCQLQPPGVSLGQSARHFWRVRSLNSVGLSDWSTQFYFDYTSETVPGTVTAISPLNMIDTAAPTYTWEDLGNATKYEVLVYDRTLRTQVYKAKQLASDICDGTICQFQPEGISLGQSMNHFWRIRPENSAGQSDWSPQFYFDYSIETLPGTVTPISPLITSETASPTFTWEDLGNVTQYELLVFDRTTRLPAHKAKHLTSDICNAGVCQLQPSSVNLGQSTRHFWRVRPQNSAGQSDWSPQFYFEYFEN